MNWEEIDGAMQRSYSFKTQTDLAEFVLKVAKASDELDHHANMIVSDCNKLLLEITTHDSNCLTEKDSNWISRIDLLS
ncbi:MAG: 4a-hydroxytetrahydrobiopterin dehydratase [Crocinitomicaceae bacterium]|nr:4a-hydroxytetrahydrobiopterin dehydratase [Crocinitomicaceae bacterium]